MASSGKFTWRITNFSGRQSDSLIYSDVFTVGGCNWRIDFYPKGRSDADDWCSVYLVVADAVGLPSGWCIAAKYSLTLVNQFRSRDSTTHGTLADSQPHREFKAPPCNSWGRRKFKRLAELRDSSNGYLVNDTLIVEAEIEVLNVSPPTVVLETFSRNLDKFIIDVAQCRNSTASSFDSSFKSKVPSLEEVKMAKQSLKECLSDLFKLNIKDRLATSLETLSRAETGLSSEEKRAVEVFRGEFDDFVVDFLTFEHDNSEFELDKLTRDQKLCSIKNYHETHLSHKRCLDDLLVEEEEYNKKMEEVKSKKAKLISEWQTSMKESEKIKSEYMALEKKLEEAEERKRIAEERMSRSSAAWSSLKAHFAN